MTAGSSTCPYTADLELVASRFLQDDDALSEIKADVTAWLDSMFRGKCIDDPVFEGMVRDFAELDAAFRSVLAAVESFILGVDRMCNGLVSVSESLGKILARSKSVTLCSDACKYKECTTNLCRPEAPHSIVAKLRRDLNFNVVEPLRAHITHNRLIRVQLETRRRRLTEHVSARRALAVLRQKRDVLPSSEVMLKAKGLADSTRIAFEEIDFPLFEWLLMLQEYRDDIYDSLLQTLKYLQYEFFAGASHCVSRILPKRMEFRPLVEMTPNELRPQVQLMLQEDAPLFEENATENHAGGNGVVSATNRLMQLKTEENCRLLKRTQRTCDFEGPPADNLAVALLVAQGFDEAAARAALRWHGNDEQAALECLLERHDHRSAQADEAQARRQVEDSVRIPSTLKWVEKLRDHRRKNRTNLPTAKERQHPFESKPQIRRNSNSSRSSSSSKTSESSRTSETDEKEDERRKGSKENEMQRRRSLI